MAQLMGPIDQIGYLAFSVASPLVLFATARTFLPAVEPPLVDGAASLARSHQLY